jgi:hypothetical protein
MNSIVRKDLSRRDSITVSRLIVLVQRLGLRPSLLLGALLRHAAAAHQGRAGGGLVRRELVFGCLEESVLVLGSVGLGLVSKSG